MHISFETLEIQRALFHAIGAALQAGNSRVCIPHLLTALTRNKFFLAYKFLESMSYAHIVEKACIKELENLSRGKPEDYSPELKNLYAELSKLGPVRTSLEILFLLCSDTFGNFTPQLKFICNGAFKDALKSFKSNVKRVALLGGGIVDKNFQIILDWNSPLHIIRIPPLEFYSIWATIECHIPKEG